MSHRAWTLVTAGALALGATTGCSHIGSSVAGQNSVNGEAWYVKTTTLFGLVLGTTVYYCPDTTGGPAKCKEAKMVELGDEAPAKASSDFDELPEPKKAKKTAEDDDDDDDDDDAAPEPDPEPKPAAGDDDDDDDSKKKKKKKKKRKKKKKKIDIDDDDDDDE